MKKVIPVKERILSENDTLALDNATRLADNHVFAINVMASPGAGKTTVIEQTIRKLGDRIRIGVIEGDVVDIDVARLRALGVPVALANTGGACHLDAVMIQKAIGDFPLSDIDLLIVENVGNLICPASFLLGTHKNIVIASVPEGDDKPYKYPAMFRGADVVLMNKFDYTAIESFDLDYFARGVKRSGSDPRIFPVSAKTGDGIEVWAGWLEQALHDHTSADPQNTSAHTRG